VSLEELEQSNVENSHQEDENETVNEISSDSDSSISYHHQQPTSPNSTNNSIISSSSSTIHNS